MKKRFTEEQIIKILREQESCHTTAAVLQQLDLIIMTDSSVAHLAASLGRPVWNLLCYFPYWLYLHDRADSPWYNSMHLIRQHTPGDWEGVFGGG